ncbi:ATP-binding protein [Proteinivorax tanatarense]|uniref:ATP-binding protein n=1 Tax=Proteinivorax tanatarense TaxID=1260629 RepID=A0AAU7VHK7_9FIRM
MEKNPYLELLDNDNYSSKLVAQRKHKKFLENLYKSHPLLEKLDDRIGILQSKIANNLAKKFKGEKVADLDKMRTELSKAINQKQQYLAKYSISTNYKEPNWQCSKCKDSGKIYNEKQVQLCTCNKKNNMILKQKSAGLPPKLVNATFNKADFSLYNKEDRDNALTMYNETKIYLNKLIQNYNDSKTFPHGLYIYGKTGGGKTYLLGCIANHLLQKGISVNYIVYADLLDRIRQTYGKEEGETEGQILRKITTVPVLLLDDLGMEKNTEFSQKHLGQIIDTRYRNLLPTIVTSNFTLTELEERARNDLYGERVIWRCIETSKILELTGNLRSPS